MHFLLVDSLYLCQFITCFFLNKVWGDLIVFHNLLRTSFHPKHCGAKNPGLIMAYIAATLNPEILKNFPGPVRVGKKKSGSGRVAGTRQGLVTTNFFPFCFGQKKSMPCFSILYMHGLAISCRPAV